MLALQSEIAKKFYYYYCKMEPTKILDYRLLDLLNIKIRDEGRRHGDPGGDPERSGAIRSDLERYRAISIHRHPAEKTPASVVAQFKLRKRGGRRATHGRHAEP